MSLIRKYFTPRVRIRPISFAELFKERHGINYDDHVFAFGNNKNYRYAVVCFGKGSLNDARQ